ncbi:hypothetical protein GCM10027589_27360 [Actinocorallia lasiicapitis]
MSDGQALALAATVERLRLELEAHRAAVRTRTVLDQATGMLAERFGCEPAEARDHLAALAAVDGLRVEVAAALLLGVEPPRE